MVGATRNLPKWMAAPTPAVSPNCDGRTPTSSCEGGKAGPPSTKGRTRPHISGEGRFHFNIRGNSHVFADGKLYLLVSVGPPAGNIVLTLVPGRGRCKTSASMAKLLVSWNSTRPPKIKLLGPGMRSTLLALP